MQTAASSVVGLSAVLPAAVKGRSLQIQARRRKRRRSRRGGDHEGQVEEEAHEEAEEEAPKDEAEI